MIRVFFENNEVINVEEDCPSFLGFIEREVEEIPSSLFKGYAGFADSTNTTKVNGEWIFNFDPTESIVKENEANAKIDREVAIEDEIEVIGGMWDVNSYSRENIRDAIDTYEYLVKRESGKPVEIRQAIPEHIVWIMADNTTRTVSYDNLREVLLAYTMRKQEIFAKYVTWKNGTRTTPFEV